MKTNEETLRTLAIYLINHLKESEVVEFPVDKRAEFIEELMNELNVSFATDDDIKNQAIEEVEDKMGEDYISDEITETEIYNHARKEIIKSFNGEQIGGLYLVESLNHAAQRIKNFLLSCETVEDVFGTDEELVEFIVLKLRQFTIRRS